MDLRNFILFLLFLSTMSGCAQHKKTISKNNPKKNAVKTKPQTKITDTDTNFLSNKADSIVAYAKKFLGVKYKYGGQDSKGFDCAGFVCFVYAHQGIKLPRTADAQALLGKEVTRKSMRPGDLVYFKGRDLKNKAIGHVGIVIENNNEKIKFISATVSSGIHIDELDGSYWKERYVLAKRILSTK